MNNYKDFLDKFFKEFDKFKDLKFESNLEPLADSVKTLIVSFSAAVQSVKDKKDHEYSDFVAESIVKMGMGIYIATLFIDAAKSDDRKAQLAQSWIDQIKTDIEINSEKIIS